MAELARRGPLEGVQPIVHRGVTVTVVPPMMRAIVRGDVAAAFGIDLPRTPCRAVTSGDRAALWLGPDEWLILAPPGNDESTSNRRNTSSPPPGAERPGEVGDSQREPHIDETEVVDVSHRQIALIVEGPLAATLLNGACPLDLHLSAFPDSMCTRTVFAKAEIVLWRQAEQRFHMEVARSFAAYVHNLLREITCT